MFYKLSNKNARSGYNPVIFWMRFAFKLGQKEQKLLIKLTNLNKMTNNTLRK